MMCCAISDDTARKLSGSISKPIVRVTNALWDISEGDGDLTSVINVRSKDETRRLANQSTMNASDI